MRRLVFNPEALFALVLGTLVGWGAFFSYSTVTADIGKPAPSECQLLVREPRMRAQIRFSGLTKQISEPDAEALLCGCQRDEFPPNPEAEDLWRSLRANFYPRTEHRLMYCLGSYQASLDDVGADVLVRSVRR